MPSFTQSFLFHFFFQRQRIMRGCNYSPTGTSVSKNMVSFQIVRRGSESSLVCVCVRAHVQTSMSGRRALRSIPCSVGPPHFLAGIGEFFLVVTVQLFCTCAELTLEVSRVALNILWSLSLSLSAPVLEDREFIACITNLKASFIKQIWGGMVHPTLAGPTIATAPNWPSPFIRQFCTKGKFI